MEKEETIKSRLKIPENTSDRNDYIQGIGKKELAAVVCVLGISLGILLPALLSGANAVLWTFAAVFMTASSVIIVKRDKTNESLVDKIKFMARYQKSQKRYLYEQKDFLMLQTGKEERQ